MGNFKYSKEEEKINKVLKMNMDLSESLLNDKELTSSRLSADENIKDTEQLL